MQALDWMGADLAVQLRRRRDGGAAAERPGPGAEEALGGPGGGEAQYEAHALRLAVQDKARGPTHVGPGFMMSGMSWK